MTPGHIPSPKSGWLLSLSIAVLACMVQPTESFPTDFVSPFSWCESTNKPRPHYGPIPRIPQLPEQYSLKVEANILAKDWTTELEEHFDRPNQRASLATTFNGTTTRTIFNFKAGEKYDIYPNGTCGTRPGQIDFFGYFTKDKSDNSKPAMATVNEMLRMGSGFNLTYVGQTAVRGIKVNHWTSCQQWEAFGSRFQLDYYFTHPDYLPATGETMGEMPIRIVLNGTAGNINMNNKPMQGSHHFLNFYDFVSIRIGQPRDLTVFEIPPGFVCHGRSDHKTMPDLPDVFEMSMEMTMSDLPIACPHQKMVYDYQHGLVETRREMMVPKGFGTPSFQPTAQSETNFDDYVEMSVHVVEDYNTGLKYVINQQNLKCSVERLVMSGEATPVMAHGEALLKMAQGQKYGNSDFTYQGVTTLRNMKVEVWGSEVNGMTQQVFFLADPSVLHSMNKPKRGPNAGGKPNSPTQGGWSAPNWSAGGQQNTGNPPNAGNGPQTPKPGPGNTAGPYGGRPKPTGQGSSGQTGGPGNTGRPRTEKPGYGNTPKPNAGGSGSMTDGNNSQGQVEHSSEEQMVPVMPRMFRQPKMMGLLFRNKTAVTSRNMTALFGQLMSDNIMKWRTMVQSAFSQEDVSVADSPDTGDQLSWGINMEKQVGNHVGEAVINVYNFKSIHSMVDHFQVSSCFDVEQTSDVMLVVKTPFEDNIQNNMEAFTNSIRRALAEWIGTSLLAISKISAVPLKSKSMGVDATAVTFTLLGRAPTQGTGLGTPSIEKSKSKLTKAIADGVSFKVDYLGSSKSYMVDKSSFVLDFMKTSRETKAALAKLSGGQTQMGKDNDSDSDSGTFSTGAVVGIALVTLVLGAAITVVVVFILHKRRHSEFPIIGIPYKKGQDVDA